MNPTETVLAVVTSGGPHLKGRTTLQKLAYFAAVKGVSDIAFRPHYYGPYSDEVSNAVTFLGALNVLDEEVVVTSERTDGWLRAVSGDVKAYTYSLSEKGKQLATDLRSENDSDWGRVDELVSICREETGLNPGVLATAAKIHFLFTRDPQSVQSGDTVTSAAGKFGWVLAEEDVARVETVLKRLGLPLSPVVPAG